MAVEPDPKDEEFASRLARYDDAIVAGGGQGPSPLPNPLDSDEVRFDEARSILHQLEELWPRPKAAEPSVHGSTWGRFRVRRELGRGAFGVVFEAFDPLLGRDVALKMPRPEVVADADLNQRFFQEARAAAFLRHPNIVLVHEAGLVGLTGYIASELCNGPTLAQWLEKRSKPVSPRFAARLVALLAETVAHAHKLGVLHRDIRPANILLFPLQSEWEAVSNSDTAHLGFVPKLSDFGLAKVLDTDSAESNSNNLSSPDFVAPEQVRGRREEIGEATDVYGLGVVLYEMLTCAVTRSQSPRLQRPRVIQPLSFPKDLPRDLVAICRKALEEDVSSRYARAADLSADLRNFLLRRPTQARPLHPLQRLARLGRRRPTEFALAVVLGLFVLVAGIGGWLHLFDLESGRSTVVSTPWATDGSEESAFRLLSYVSSVKLAQQALDQADVAECRRQLIAQLPREGEPDPRGFEWYRLWNRCHADERTLTGFSGAVYDVALSEDGRFLAASSADKSVREWDLQKESGAALEVPFRHLGEVNVVAYSPDGAWLASGGDDTTVRVRGPKAVDPVVFRGHRAGVMCLAFSPSSELLASGGKDDQVCLWRLSDGYKVQNWELECSGVEAIAFAVNGHGLVLGCGDGSVRVIDELGSDKVRKLASLRENLHALVVLPDDMVACAGRDQSITCFNLQSGEEVSRWRAHRDWVQHLATDKSGSLLASSGRDGAVHVWDRRSRQQRARIVGHEGRIWGVGMSPASDRIATSGQDGTVKLWDWRRTGENPVLTAWKLPPRSLVFAPDKYEVWTGFEDGRVELWNLESWQNTGEWDSGSPIVSLAASPDGRILATAHGDGTARLWGVDTPGPTVLEERSIADPTVIVFSRESHLVACGSESGQILLWSPGEEQTRTIDIERAVLDLAFVDDALLSWDHQGFLKKWNCATGELMAELGQHRQPTREWAISPDQTLVATASGDGTVNIWSLATRDSVKQFQGQIEVIGDLAFAPDGKSLALGYRDGRVRIWHLATQQMVYEQETPFNEVVDVEFALDGRALAITGNEREGGRRLTVIWWAKGPTESETSTFSERMKDAQPEDVRVKSQ